MTSIHIPGAYFKAEKSASELHQVPTNQKYKHL